MISIKYKGGWLRFKTIEELSEITGWSFDRITFALRTKTSILGVEIVYGEIKRVKEPKPTPTPKLKSSEKQVSYLELKNELRLVNKRRLRADRVIKRYEESWFPGRIETNEIKHARHESARLLLEMEKIRRAIDHYKRYEQRKKSSRQRV